MFDNFTKDKQIVDKYIDNYHLHKNNIFLLRYKLHTHDNPKEFINEFFAGIESGNVAVITEAIVYDEDAYLNAAAAQMDDKHRRFYTINEILDFTKEYANLNFFLNFSEEVKIENILKQNECEDKAHEILKIFNAFPENIKKILSFKEDNSKLTALSPNIGVFIFRKK